MAMAKGPQRGGSAEWKKRTLQALLGLAVIIALFVVLAHFVDLQARDWLRARKLPTEIKDTFEFLNNYAQYPGLVLMAWIALTGLPQGKPKWRLVYNLLLGLALVALVIWASKYGVYRLRPKATPETVTSWLQTFSRFTENVKPYGRQSFFSGDAAVAFVVSVILAFHFPKFRYLLYALAVGCALSRFVLNTHWVSDIFLGSVVGYLVGKLVLILTGETRNAP